MRRLPGRSLTRDQRGITLVEVTVVGVLAVIVMLALTGFYINSQATWIDASSQAVAQREASFILETIVDSVHVANSADVSTPGTLILRDVQDPVTLVYPEKCRFWFNVADSLVHIGKGGTTDYGPVGMTRILRFDVTTDGKMVKILALEVRSPTGRTIRLSTNAAFYN